MGTLIEDILSDALFVFVIGQFLYHILRRILANPQKTLKDWMTSWSTGLGLFFYGFVIVAIFRGEYKIDFGILLCSLGIVFCIVKIISKIVGSLVSHFIRRRPAVAHGAAPASAPASGFVAGSPGEPGT